MTEAVDCGRPAFSLLRPVSADVHRAENNPTLRAARSMIAMASLRQLRRRSFERYRCVRVEHLNRNTAEKPIYRARM